MERSWWFQYLFPLSLHFLIGDLSAEGYKDDWPFEIVWNLPSASCATSFNVSIPVENYGILANKKQNFYGDRIVIFYEKKLGIYPYVTKDGVVHNGGIPQAVDLVTHLKLVAEDIRNAIPSTGFTGIGVIDWEGWRPVWRANWGSKKIYKKMSYRLAKQQLPHGTKKQRRKLARQQFENAAKWKWIFEASTALFPTIYLRMPNLKRLQIERHFLIQEQILETKRFLSEKEPIPIYAYSRLMYDPYHKKMKHFYSKADLCSSIKQSADLGLNGVVLWGSWYSVSTKENCQNVSNYVQDLLGPYSLVVREQAEICAKKRCSGQGRCILDPEPYCKTVTKFLEYHCKCRPPYRGEYCDKSHYWDYYRRL